jgi:hypothetical protein
MDVRGVAVPEFEWAEKASEVEDTEIDTGRWVKNESAGLDCHQRN